MRNNAQERHMLHMQSMDAVKTVTYTPYVTAARHVFTMTHSGDRLLLSSIWTWEWKVGPCREIARSWNTLDPRTWRFSLQAEKVKEEWGGSEQWEAESRTDRKLQGSHQYSVIHLLPYYHFPIWGISVPGVECAQQNTRNAALCVCIYTCNTDTDMTQRCCCSLMWPDNCNS